MFLLNFLAFIIIVFPKIFSTVSKNFVQGCLIRRPNILSNLLKSTKKHSKFHHFELKSLHITKRANIAKTSWVLEVESTNYFELNREKQEIKLLPGFIYLLRYLLGLQWHFFSIFFI
jgi:hypothetical protein